MKEQSYYLRIIKERWGKLFFPPLENVIDFYHGNPLIPPPKSMKDAFIELSQKAIFYNPDTWNDDVRNLKPFTTQIGESINLHSYRIYYLTVPELRKAAYEDFTRDGIPLDLNKNQIIPGAGVTHLTSCYIHSLARKGHEVLLPAPTYSSFLTNSHFINGKLRFIPAHKPEYKYKLTIDQIKEGYELFPKVKAILLLNPVNPTGEVLSYELLVEIGKFAIENDLYIIVDEIYRDLIYDEKSTPFVSAASIKIGTNHLFERTITIRGLSKSYGFAKGRIAVACSSQELMNELTPDILILITTLTPSDIIQYIAAKVLINTPQKYLEDSVKIYKENFEFVVNHIQLINQLIIKKGEIKFNIPQSGFFLLLDFSFLLNMRLPTEGFISSDYSFVNYLLHEKKVALISGSAFGYNETDMIVRMTYSSPKSILLKGLSLISNCIHEILNFNCND